MFSADHLFIKGLLKNKFTFSNTLFGSFLDRIRYKNDDWVKYLYGNIYMSMSK